MVAAEETAAVVGRQGEGAPEDRFRTWVAITIAIVSVLGAVVAFTGTLVGQDARQLDQQGLQDASSQQQIINTYDELIQQDLRNLVPYQEEIKAAAVLRSQAALLDATDPTDAEHLRLEAEADLLQARYRLRLFSGAVPQPGPSGGVVQFDSSAALQRLESADPSLPLLRPAGTLGQAAIKHDQSANLVGLVALFIGALLFLTLAQFTRPSIRRFFAAAGGLTGCIAVALWIVLLATGP